MSKNRAETPGKPQEDVQILSSTERCHARWHGLFFGVWTVVARRDPTTLLTVQEALIAAGLMYKGGRPFAQFTNGLFDIDPRPDIVRLTQGFRDDPRVPSLRGKTRKVPDPVSVYMDCQTAYFQLKTVPRSGESRRVEMRRLVPEILPSLQVVRRRVSQKEIDKLAQNFRGPGATAVGLIALSRGVLPETIARMKTRGATHFPADLRSLWKRGIERHRVQE